MGTSISVLHFSPTGSSKKVAMLAAGCFDSEIAEYDLICRGDLSVKFSKDDIVIVSVPVFMGRVPTLAAEALCQFKGGGSKVICLTVFGNRHYDDALLELCDILKQQNFKVAAAGAFAAQHSINGTVGAGRPNDDDIKQIREFAGQAKEKILSGGVVTEFTVPGNHPYKVMPRNKRTIEVSDSCVCCGLCSARCPVSAIPASNFKETDSDKCIGCMRCIHICPHGARNFSEQVMEEIKQRMSQSLYVDPKANVWFL